MRQVLVVQGPGGSATSFPKVVRTDKVSPDVTMVSKEYQEAKCIPFKLY